MGLAAGVPEAHPFGRQAIDVRSPDDGAVAAEVLIAQVIGEENDDVGRFAGGGKRGGSGGEEKVPAMHVSEQPAGYQPAPRRAFNFAVSAARSFGGALVSSERRRLAEMPAISSTAAWNDSSFAFDGLLKPLIFLTN